VPHLSFADRLKRAWADTRSLLCVGLDPLMNRMPLAFARSSQGVFEFNREIIAATAPYACAFKPQIAHYSALEAEDQLKRTIDWIREHYPGHLVILDAKRGDIESTARFYAVEAFERYEAHAVTLNPYLGISSLKPFLDYPDRGCFVLCRTSNADSAEFQLQGDPPLYLQIASRMAGWRGKEKSLGLVAGATWPEDLGRIRQQAPNLPILVPGIGTQQGDLVATLEHGLNIEGNGLIINVTRSLIYSSTASDFCERVNAKAAELSGRINRIRDSIRSQKKTGGS